MKYSKYIGSVLIVMAITLSNTKLTAQVRSNLNYFNNGAPNSSAFLDASSSPAWNNSSNFGKGLIFPRVDLTAISSLVINGSIQSDNFPTLMDGLIVYNTAFGNSIIGNIAVSPGFYYYKNSSNDLQGGSWVPFLTSSGSQSSSDWALKGNANLGKTSFLGTLDLQPLIFKVRGIEAARIMVNGNQPGSLNLNAPLQLNGEHILSFGTNPIENNTLVGNIMTSSLTGQNNTMVGAGAGKNITTGNYNTLIGTLAGSEIKEGGNNTFIGDNAGTYSIKGSFNTAIGRNAGPVGDLKYATAIGNGALAKQSSSLILGNINANRVFIGINTETPRATLDVATDDAIVLPVGDTKTQPTAAVAGMLRFNAEINFAEYYNNYNAWVNLSRNTGWTLEGNFGTIPAYNYVGTADNQSMVFGANGKESFRIVPKTLSQSAMVNIKAPLWMNGQRMLWLEDAGKGPNIMVGYWDAFVQSYAITGANNILFGPSSGSKITSGNNNIFLGKSAGASTVAGNDNIGIGVQAGPDLAGVSNSMVFYANNRPRKSNVLLFGDEISGHVFSAVGINTAKPDAIFEVNSTGAMIVPSGATAERPATAEPGMLRFNQTTKLLEYFEGARWVSLDPPANIYKQRSNLLNAILNPNEYYTYDIPFPEAKLGGVVSVYLDDEGGFHTGLNGEILITEKRVLSDGIVRVVFWNTPRYNVTRDIFSAL